MPQFTGIDVSAWQGIIYWKAVKASGVQFVILKAGGSDDGFYEDYFFAQNYKDAVAAGLHVGAYYFVGKNCKTAADGKADAVRFLKILKNRSLDYPAFIDVEATRPADKKGVTDATIAFCNEIKKAGYRCGIYSSAVSGFVDRLDDSRLKAYDHWVADYRGSNDYKGTTAIWQHSSKGKVPGIDGNVDLDISYKAYATAKVTTPKPTTKPAPAKETFRVGQTVYFKGGNHYYTSTDTQPTGTKQKAGPVLITARMNAPHPYHVRHTNSQSNVYGWVDANTLVTKSPEKLFKRGDKVKIRSGASYWNGVPVPKWVLADTWIVEEDQPKNSARVIIDKNVKGTNRIMSPISAEFLIRQ